MIYANFDSLIKDIKSLAKSGVIAVAGAGDLHTIEAVLKAQDEGFVTPLLVGDKAKILEVYQRIGRQAPSDKIIYDVKDSAEACIKAVSLVREGEADFLIKGAVDTKTYLKAVVNKERGLGTGRLMSHFSILEVPGYHKLVVPVDGGMVPYPTLQQKKEIILNTVEIFHKLGYKEPKVAVLTCVEKVNPSMPETIEADALKKMNINGEITGCIVEGPISYDCAMSKEYAEIKGYHSPVSGDADILLAPNIHAANIMGKIFSITCKARMAGFIVGTVCPVIMTSRGATSEEKFLSIVLATAVTENNRP